MVGGWEGEGEGEEEGIGRGRGVIGKPVGWFSGFRWLDWGVGVGVESLSGVFFLFVLRWAV